MRIPLWLLALLFIGWTAWTVNRICARCGCSGETTAVTGATAALSSGAPLFLWNSAAPVDDPRFRDFKKGLLGRGGQGDTLLITGQYRAGEKNTSKFANLGLARADAIRALMMPEIPDSRIHTAAQTVSDSLMANGPARESATFSWLKMMLKANEGAIIEANNAVTILFPTNSTVKEKDPKVDAYLKILCDKHKDDKTTFSVVGHADNVGNDEANTALGLGRAQSITQFMVRNGIAQNRIRTDSKGKVEPVADNSTEDGRHQNRRVVITVNN